jgi:3-phenylpropionate/cinnamic acid dioxygenase small subunit
MKRTNTTAGSGVSRFVFLLCSLLTATLLQAADADTQQGLADRAAIQELIVRYVTALDTRDADLYVSVFTEDAEFDIEGDVRKGHDAIRGIVTGLQESRAANTAAGRPNVDLYHAILNSSIQLLDADEATHRSYWQTLRKSAENTIVIGAMGIYEDQLVKQQGEWKIKKRVLTNFIQR